MQAACPRLVHGFTHDLRRDALDLDVHLQGGDALAGTGHFEVHVAVVIFGASDVSENGVSIAFLDEAHGNTCDGSLEGDASIHERNRGTANGCHRGRRVRFKNVGDDAHGVGPFFHIRKNRGDRAFRQRSVPDFTTACAAHEANFANRERREVVVQEEALLAFALEAFEALLVVGGAESGCDQGLGFAACEDGAAVGSRQDAGFDPDVANLVELAVVWTTSGDGNVLAEDLLQQEFVVVRELFQGGFVVFRDGGLQFLLEFRNQLVAFRFRVLRGVEGVGQARADVVLQVIEVGFVEFDRSDLALLLSDSARQIADGGADFLDFGVGELNGVEDGLFFYFFGAGLDHDDGVGRGDDHQAEKAFVHFLICRVNDELAVDQAYADCANRTVEGDVAQREGGGCAVDGEDVGIVFRVGGEDQGNDLRLAAESFGEQRADGAIDLAAGEGFAVAHAAFALDESAGDASASIGIFAVVDGEGEERDADAGLGVGAGRG